jgi:hypothetical protein
LRTLCTIHVRNARWKRGQTRVVSGWISTAYPGPSSSLSPWLDGHDAGLNYRGCNPGLLPPFRATEPYLVPYPYTVAASFALQWRAGNGPAGPAACLYYSLYSSVAVLVYTHTRARAHTHSHTHTQSLLVSPWTRVLAFIFSFICSYSLFPTPVVPTVLWCSRSTIPGLIPQHGVFYLSF